MCKSQDGGNGKDEKEYLGEREQGLQAPCVRQVRDSSDLFAIFFVLIEQKSVLFSFSTHNTHTSGHQICGIFPYRAAL